MKAGFAAGHTDIRAVLLTSRLSRVMFIKLPLVGRSLACALTQQSLESFHLTHSRLSRRAQTGHLELKSDQRHAFRRSSKQSSFRYSIIFGSLFPPTTHQHQNTGFPPSRGHVFFIIKISYVPLLVNGKIICFSSVKCFYKVLGFSVYLIFLG